MHHSTNSAEKGADHGDPCELFCRDVLFMNPVLFWPGIINFEVLKT